MMLPKNRRRMAALIAENALLSSTLDSSERRIGELLEDTTEMRERIRNARAISEIAARSLPPLTMTYQYVQNINLILDGKDPL